MDGVRLIGLNCVVGESVYTLSDEKDRRGNLFILDESGKRYKVHKRRIIDASTRPGSLVPIKINGHYVVHCPECSVSIPIIADSSIAECAKHGQFEIVWQGEKKMSEVTTTPETEVKATMEQTDTGFNLSEVTREGELWTKDDIKFDQPDIQVLAHVLIVKNDEGKYRKLNFNTYNGTLGKKKKTLDIAALKSGAPLSNGKSVGFDIKGDIEDERNKISKRGYRKVD